MASGWKSLATVCLAAHFLLGAAVETQAQGFNANSLGGSFSFSESEAQETPVLFAADEVFFDREDNFVSAKGNVEIEQLGRTVRADELYYDAENQELLARGNVLMIDADGNRMTVDEIALNTAFTKGFMRNIQMKLAPTTRIAAAYAERRGEDELSIHRAVLSPCPACEERPERPPVWQIKARQVELDGARGNVYYRDARFELLGIPVFYAPFFAHADPRLDRKTGFLSPTLDLGSKRGYGLKIPYFVDLTDATDVTVSVTPYFGRYWTDLNNASQTGKNGLGGAKAEVQFRQAIPRGTLLVDTYGLWERQSSYLDQNNFANDAGQLHGLAVARFDWGITDNLRLSTKGHLWSHREAPLEFAVDASSVISDTAQLEGFFGRSYLDIYAESNRTARQSLANVEHQYPVFGKASYDYISEPFLGGSTVRATVDTRAIYRKDGRDYTRASVESWWHSPLILGSVKVDVKAGGIASLYQVDETNTAQPLVATPTTSDFSGSVARAQPGASVEVAWPLHRPGERWSQTITPKLGLAYGGPDQSTGEIPNEDTSDIELDQANLFSAFRTNGQDFIDPGLRLNYGVEYDLIDKDDLAVGLFVGQSYELLPETGLISVARQNGSGIEDQLSHVIAGADFDIGRINGSWRTRYDFADAKFYRNDLNVGLDLGRLDLTADYRYNQANDTASKTETVSASATLKVFERWALSASFQQNLQSTNARTYGSGLTYTHPCFDVVLNGKRAYDANNDFDDTYSFAINVPFLSASVGQSFVRASQ